MAQGFLGPDGLIPKPVWANLAHARDMRRNRTVPLAATLRVHHNQRLREQMARLKVHGIYVTSNPNF